MLQTTKCFTLLLAGCLFFIFACQPQESQEELYPENEIPVSTSSQEALQEFVNGLELLDLGNARQARPYFEKALELDPDFVSAQMYRTFSSNSAKDFGDNQKKLMAMSDKANEAEKMLIDMMAANAKGDDMAVLEINKKLVEKYPESARALDALAGNYSGMEDHAKARELLAKAVKMNPDFTPAIRNLGFSYLFSSPKDFSKAEEYMAKVVENIPDNARAHIDLGDCYRAQKDLDKALASYTKAAELDPEDQVALSKAGHANSFLGNHDAARKNYQDARAVSEYGTDSYNWEAFTYLYEGDHEKALAFLQEAANTVDGMDIPESNKIGTKMNCAFNCAMIAMHYGDTEQLNKMVEMMKPLSDRIGKDVGTDAAKLNQKANMQYWDAIAAASAGDYDTAAALANEINKTLEPINDPQKNRRFDRVHSYVNFQQGNYEKALEHMGNLGEDDLYAKYWMGKAHMESGNKEKAMELFNEIVDNNFNSVGYALIRGELKELVSASP